MDIEAELGRDGKSRRQALHAYSQSCYQRCVRKWALLWWGLHLTPAAEGAATWASPDITSEGRQFHTARLCQADCIFNSIDRVVGCKVGITGIGIM